MIRVEMRELYYPVYYVHRIERNEAALGFDLFGNSTRRKILIRSLESGNVMSSSHITLIQEDRNGAGFLIFILTTKVIKFRSLLLSEEKYLRGLSFAFISLRK